MDRYLPRLSERGRLWARFLALLALIALLVWIAIVLRQVLTPIVAALALAYILNPLVTMLERKYRVRRVTSITVGLVLLLAVGGALLVAGTAQLMQLTSNLPTYAGEALKWVDQTIPGLLTGGGEQATTDSQPLLPDAERSLTRTGREQLTQLVTEHGLAVGRSLVGYVGRIVSNAFYWLSLTVLLPLYTFFFLLRFNEIVQHVRGHLPAAYRPTIVRVVTTIDEAISTFFRGRLLICLAVGTLTGLGWLIVDVPYNLALGALLGMLNLVPFLSVLALPPALLLAYLHATDIGTSWALAMTLVLAVYLAVQAIESFVLTPLILSKASGLHPITTVIALLIGGQLAGVLGLLLAIPITSTLRSLAAEYVLPELRRLADTPEPEPHGPADTSSASTGASPTDRPLKAVETAEPSDVPPEEKP